MESAPSSDLPRLLVEALRRWSGPESAGLRRGFHTRAEHSLRAESRAAGRTDGRAKMAHELLLARGIELSEGFLADPSALAELPESAIVAAALAYDGERDFLLRLSRRQS